MDWRKTSLGFSAMAAAAGGGRYRVERPPGYFWTVEHEARDAAGQWCLRRIEGPWATIEEAKAGAEADNQEFAQRQSHSRIGG